jgi:hypothetical protein
MVLRDNQVRLFEKHLAALPDIDDLPSRKLALWAKGTVVVPPHTIGFVVVGGSGNFDGEVYVEAATRQKPGHEYSIPGCVTAIGGVLSIRNMADNNLKVSTGPLLARDVPCSPESSTAEVSNFSFQSCKLLPFQLADVKDQLGPNLGKDQQDEILKLINKFRDCFAVDAKELGKTNVTDMHIRLHDDVPLTYRSYRLSYSERIIVRGIVQDLMDNGIVREYESPYSSTILLVKKKSAEYRMCVDYRSLNAKTVKNRYPLPRVGDYFEKMHGNQYFTTLDLASGYHQIKMAEDSISKPAFVTPDGHYEYLRMPFGLVNAPAVFQRAINSILGRLLHHTAVAYLDDILLPSTTFSTRLNALREVFTLFRHAGITFRLSKCKFFHEKLDYLGQELSLDGIRPGRAKTKAISNYPRPTNVHEIRQFIGLTFYFRKFIQGFAAIAKPLTVLTKTNIPFVWGQEEKQAFQTLTQRLAERPVLALYNQEASTELHTDASVHGIDGILLQHQQDETLRPNCYCSRQTSKAEQHYHSYELETLAVVESMRRSFIQGAAIAI